MAQPSARSSRQLGVEVGGHPPTAAPDSENFWLLFEATAYFVLEHQPVTCRQLPPNGNVTWHDIQIEVNGNAVPDAQLVAKQEQPRCSSKATVLDSSTVEITWDVKAEA